MAKRMTHVDRLRKARVLGKNPRHLTKRDEAKLNRKLTKKEVDTLVKMAKKVGNMKLSRHTVSRAWFL